MAMDKAKVKSFLDELYKARDLARFIATGGDRNSPTALFGGDLDMGPALARNAAGADITFFSPLDRAEESRTPEQWLNALHANSRQSYHTMTGWDGGEVKPGLIVVVAVGTLRVGVPGSPFMTNETFVDAMAIDSSGKELLITWEIYRGTQIKEAPNPYVT